MYVLDNLLYVGQDRVDFSNIDGSPYQHDGKPTYVREVIVSDRKCSTQDICLQISLYPNILKVML